MLPAFKNEPFTDFSLSENKDKMVSALERVHSDFGKTYPLVIDGNRVNAQETFTSINPSNKDESVGIFQKASEKEADMAIGAATRSFKQWSRIPPKERAIILLKGAKELRRRKFEFSAAMVYEEGKNWAEADGDVAEAIDYFEFYAREMLRYSERQPITPFSPEYSEYYYIPLGPVVVIPPWNFPAAIMMGMSIAALVTGNTVVLKPSSDAPLIAYKFVEMMENLGLPSGVLNLVTGPGGKVGDYLVRHPKTRMIAFTGSKAVGSRINEMAAKLSEGQIWIKRVIAEMGGKDFTIVDSEANLEDAANALISGAYGFQGQKCSALSRAIVVQDVYDRLLEIVLDKVKNVNVGPAKDNPAMGPVINEPALEKIMHYIDIGKNESTLIYGGNRVEGNGFFIEPTIFKDVPRDARIAQEEIFGPVLAVIKAQDFDDAISIANSTRYGLTGSFFTLNREKIVKGKEELFVGNLYVNRKCTGALVGVHPFGGFNMSGTDSKAGGKDYLLLFMQAKSVSEKL